MEFLKKDGPLGIKWGIWIGLGAVAIGLGLYLRKKNEDAAASADQQSADVAGADTFNPADMPGYDSYYGVDPITGGGSPPVGPPVGVNVGGEGTIRIIVDDQRHRPKPKQGGGGGHRGTGGGVRRCPSGSTYRNGRCVPIGHPHRK